MYSECAEISRRGGIIRLTRSPLLATLAAAVLSVGLGACTSQPEPSAGDAASSHFVGHVHGLGVDPADDTVYVAAHGGVFRLVDKRLELVANRAQDTMGFTVVGPNRFIASGHPAPIDVDRPIHLGLIESTDAALTWQERSLSGKADFHSIEQGVDALYGYDSQSKTVMATSDKLEWTVLFKGGVYDHAAHPSQPGVVVVATDKGVVTIKNRAAAPLPTPEELVVVEWPRMDRLVGINHSGAVHQSTDGGQSWKQTGQVPGMVEAFDATAERWLVATDQGIYSSTNNGGSWIKLL
jgi:hypothetical protein